jgi:hypothetical protein
MLDMWYDPPDRNTSKPIKWVLFDSFVIGLIAFVASLPYDRIPTQLDIYVALRAFFYAFAMQLAIEYKIKPWFKNRNRNNVNIDNNWGGD